MRTAISKSWLIVVLGCAVSLTGCSNERIEKEFFFSHPAKNRIERLRQYSLPDQYRLFRYGNDRFHPPLTGLAAPIAERGKSAVPFLIEKLQPSVGDLELRDILLVFETMNSTGTYDVRSDKAVISLLKSRIAAMKDEGWKETCTDMLKRIESAGSQN